MIGPSELLTCARKLHTHDVDRGGWVPETDSFAQNTSRTLVRLTRTLMYADLDDAAMVRQDVAPNALASALRLCRWASVPISHAKPDTVNLIAMAGHRLHNAPIEDIALLEGVGALASYLDESTYAETDDKRRKNEEGIAIHAARLLITGAGLQANAHNFDLPTAFDSWLASQAPVMRLNP